MLLHGMPGGGKTACALELAYGQEHAIDRLVWYKAPDEGMDITGALTDFALTMERYLNDFRWPMRSPAPASWPGSAAADRADGAAPGTDRHRQRRVAAQPAIAIGVTMVGMGDRRVVRRQGWAA